MRSTVILLLLATIFGTPNKVLAERMTPERLWDLSRIGNASISPDGKQLAYLVTRFDLEANEGKTDLVIQPISTLTLQPTTGSRF